MESVALGGQRPRNQPSPSENVMFQRPESTFKHLWNLKDPRPSKSFSQPLNMSLSKIAHQRSVQGVNRGRRRRGGRPVTKKKGNKNTFSKQLMMMIYFFFLSRVILWGQQQLGKATLSPTLHLSQRALAPLRSQPSCCKHIAGEMSANSCRLSQS